MTEGVRAGGRESFGIANYRYARFIWISSIARSECVLLSLPANPTLRTFNRPHHGAADSDRGKTREKAGFDVFIARCTAHWRFGHLAPGSRPGCNRHRRKR